MKICSKCKVEQEEKDFFRAKHGKNGLSAHCKKCHRVRNKRWMAANKNRSRQWNRKWRDSRPMRAAFTVAKSGAGRRGIPFTIEFSDLFLPQHCPVLGIELDYSSGKGVAKDNSPSLDRLDSSRGYIPGNVNVISWRANVVKNSGTAAEHRAIADWMEQIQVLPVNEVPEDDEVPV